MPTPLAKPGGGGGDPCFNPPQLAYFVYDGAIVNGQTMATAKGRMSEAYTATCQTCSKSTDLGFSYTARGEVATTYESTPNSSGYYNVGMTYWPNAMVNTMSSPSFPTFTYTPDRPRNRPTHGHLRQTRHSITSTARFLFRPLMRATETSRSLSRRTRTIRIYSGQRSDRLSRLAKTPLGATC